MQATLIQTGMTIYLLSAVVVFIVTMIDLEKVWEMSLIKSGNRTGKALTVLVAAFLFYAFMPILNTFTAVTSIIRNINKGE